MIKKFTSILFVFVFICIGNFALANTLDCSKIEGNTPGRNNFDKGVYLFNSIFVDATNEACVEEQVFADSAMKLKGWVWNDNLGWFSFRAENEDVDVALENRGIELVSSIEYGVDLVYAPEPMSPDKYKLVGYGWGDNIGWIKFNCEANFNYSYDTNDCSTGNYGVSLVLNEATGLHEFQGTAYSELFDDYINFSGLSVELLLSDLDFTPRVSLRKRASSDGNVYANNMDGYFIDVSFFDDLNLNKSIEFRNSGLDFCLIFEDNRKLDLSEADQAVVGDCGQHNSNRRFPDNLNKFTSENNSFTFLTSKYTTSSQLTSLIPTDTVFKISKIKVYGLGYEKFFDLGLDLNYKEILEFAVRNNPSIKSSPPTLDSCFSPNVEYNWNFGRNETWFCSRVKTALNGFSYNVNLDFSSSIANYDFSSMRYFEYPATAGTPPVDRVLDLKQLSQSTVRPIYFYVPSINSVNLLDLNLGLTGEYVLNYKGLLVKRPLPLYSALNSENYEGLNIDGIVSEFGSNINISDNQVFETSTVALRSKVRERIDTYKSRKLKCTYTAQLDFRTCLSDFHAGVYEVQSSDSIKKKINVSKLLNLFNSDGDAVIVLKDIELIVDRNINLDAFPGIVLVSSDDKDVNMYVSNDVTDIKAHVFVDGFIFPYASLYNLEMLIKGQFDKVLSYESDATNYNEILFLGSFRSKNCIGCKDELPPRNPDGSLADSIDQKTLDLFDFVSFRKSPLEFRLESTPLPDQFRYAACDATHVRRGAQNDDSNARSRAEIYNPDDPKADNLCRRSTVNGQSVKSSQNSTVLIESDFKVMYSTNFVYRTPLRDMPIFRK